MADFQYFNNYWFFSELTTKNEELEHFRLLCDAYRIDEMKEEIGDQVGKLAGHIIVSNWVDYRASLLPHRYRRLLPEKSLRRPVK